MGVRIDARPAIERANDLSPFQGVDKKVGDIIKSKTWETGDGKSTFLLCKDSVRLDLVSSSPTKRVYLHATVNCEHMVEVISFPYTLRYCSVFLLLLVGLAMLLGASPAWFLVPISLFVISFILTFIVFQTYVEKEKQKIDKFIKNSELTALQHQLDFCIDFQWGGWLPVPMDYQSSSYADLLKKHQQARAQMEAELREHMPEELADLSGEYLCPTPVPST